MKSPRSAFILRQLRHPGRQMGVFVLCVVLSIVIIVAAGGFSAAVNRTVLKDARSLHAADIIVRSSYPLSESILAEVKALSEEGSIRVSAVDEFYSMVRTADEKTSILSSIKVVAPGYPFYGEAALISGRALFDALVPGRVVVENAFLSRLGLHVGNPVWVGDAKLVIADVVTKEPDRPMEIFSMGPRVFVNAKDLNALDLVKPGSRVRYRLLVKVENPENLDRIYSRLKAVAFGDEKVDTYRTIESRAKRFFDNFLFFLSLMGILTLLLSGIGIQSTVTAYLASMTQTIAVMKTLGATQRFVTVTFMVIVMVLGAAGTVLGIGFGYGLQRLMAVFLNDILPMETRLALTRPVLLESLSIGIGGVALFCYLPLVRLKNIKPVAVFRKQVIGESFNWRTCGIMGLMVGLMALVITRRMPSPISGFYVLAGMAGLIAVSAGLSQLFLWIMRRVSVSSLAFIQARKGLFRPGNRTRSILVTFSAAFATLFTMHIVQSHLEEAFVGSFPPDAPNLFFIDIQPDQCAGVLEILGKSAPLYPLVRARLTKINDVPIDPAIEAERRGDNLARPFNLTYRDHLLDDERLLKGDGLFDPTIPGVQVSVLDTVAKIKSMKIGDRLEFNIQGIPLEAIISSIRTREKETLRPFFYFVFKEDALSGAPRTFFSAIKVSESEKADLQNRIASRFPNVTTLDMSATVATFYRVATQLSAVIRFLGIFSLLAGILILTASIFATRLARTREAVYFRILGADNAFVHRVFNLENLLIGFIGAMEALIMAHAGSWWIITRVMEIPYRWHIGGDFLLLAGSMMLVLMVGRAASGDILKKKPIVFLREETME
jgi:putative ABC transport system permease protein